MCIVVHHIDWQVLERLNTICSAAHARGQQQISRIFLDRPLRFARAVPINLPVVNEAHRDDEFGVVLTHVYYCGNAEKIVIYPDAKMDLRG